MKKKTFNVTIEFPIDDLREEAVAYMNDIFECGDYHPDIVPSDEELERRFDKCLRDSNFIRHIQHYAQEKCLGDLYSIFEDSYEEEYLEKLRDESDALSEKERSSHETERGKRLESAKAKLDKAKLTPEEREVLGLKT